MEMEELIDQVAFGSSAPRVSSSLGMYLSPETIYIAEVHVARGGKLEVDHLVRIPVPPPEAQAAAKEGEEKKSPPSGATSLATDFLADSAKLSAVIRQSMSQIRWSTKNVMVTLSHHLGLLRYFTMPAVERRFWKSAVPLEAKKYIPIPFDVLSHDYEVSPLAPDSGGRPRQGVLIGVTQKKNIAGLQTLLQSLDLNPVGLEVAPCSVLRLWESLDKSAKGKPYAQVHFDGGNIRILLADKGFPVFFRELFLGPEALIGDNRKVDLGGCVSFAQKLLGVESLGQVRVSGATPNLPQWQETFAAELGVDCGLQDTAAMLGIKGGDWGGYAAIGSALRFVAPTPMTLDLGRTGVGDDERRLARDILVVAGLLALWFAALGLFRSTLYQYKARELATYKREPDIEMAFAGKGATEIEEMFREMQLQVDLTGDLGGERISVSAILKDISESLPDKVWVTQVTLSNPIRKGATLQEFQMMGHAVGETLAQEQDLTYQFKERLQKSPVVGKVFNDIQVSVSGRPIPPESTVALDPGALTEVLEKRTTFSISAKSKLKTGGA